MGKQEGFTELQKLLVYLNIYLKENDASIYLIFQW